MKTATLIVATACAALWAQEIQMPANLDKLAAKAEETVDVTLNGSMLRLAGRFLSEKDKDQAYAKNLIAGLQSIAVRSFRFARDNEYEEADVNAVRAQVQKAPWMRIVGVRSKKDGENVDVYFKDAGNGQLGGVVVIAAEARELTVVSIVGTIDPAQLAALGGEFGIPKLDMGVLANRKGAWK